MHAPEDHSKLESSGAKDPSKGLKRLSLASKYFRNKENVPKGLPLPIVPSAACKSLTIVEDDEPQPTEANAPKQSTADQIDGPISRIQLAPRNDSLRLPKKSNSIIRDSFFEDTPALEIVQHIDSVPELFTPASPQTLSNTKDNSRRASVSPSIGFGAGWIETVPLKEWFRKTQETPEDLDVEKIPDVELENGSEAGKDNPSSRASSLSARSSSVVPAPRVPTSGTLQKTDPSLWFSPDSLGTLSQPAMTDACSRTIPSNATDSGFGAYLEDEEEPEALESLQQRRRTTTKRTHEWVRRHSILNEPSETPKVDVVLDERPSSVSSASSLSLSAPSNAETDANSEAELNEDESRSRTSRGQTPASTSERQHQSFRYHIVEDFYRKNRGTEPGREHVAEELKKLKTNMAAVRKLQKLKQSPKAEHYSWLNMPYSRL
ncbi:hypothetical protein MKZ38_001932 [Zalerion maritima]|uniref:Uncharacterized protein n=1 Tax=Zalerion maritima TaxID=339359 RepID=A0AAD5WST7_9PEZI|nr:hypothetical protein MKZ38_001932 [Zalerion maritima]